MSSGFNLLPSTTSPQVSSPRIGSERCGCCRNNTVLGLFIAHQMGGCGSVVRLSNKASKRRSKKC